MRGASCDVPVPFSDAPADCDDGQRVTRVLIRIAHPAAIEEKRVIEERSVAVWSCVQLFQEFAEQGAVVRVDLGNLGDVLWIVAVMRDRMVLLGRRRAAGRSRR